MASIFTSKTQKDVIVPPWVEEEKESPSLVGKAAIKIYEDKIGKIRDVMKWDVQEMSKPQKKIKIKNKKIKGVFWRRPIWMERSGWMNN